MLLLTLHDRYEARRHFWICKNLSEVIIGEILDEDVSEGLVTGWAARAPRYHLPYQLMRSGIFKAQVLAAGEVAHPAEIVQPPIHTDLLSCDGIRVAHEVMGEAALNDCAVWCAEGVVDQGHDARP